MGRTIVVLVSAVLTAASATTVSAQAQRTRLFVTGFPVSFPTPTGADFANGFIVSATATTFSVDAQTGTRSQRTATVSIRCALPCPTNGGPKPLATLKWRRADLSTWNTLTTSDVQVEQRAMVRQGQNDPWSNQIFWRFDLDWGADQPGSATAFNVVFTLTVTVP
jgi:hypothetical protein